MTDPRPILDVLDVREVASALVSFAVEPGVTLVGDAWGSAGDPAVILMHGGGQTRHAWGQTARLLAARGRYALSLDLRGHGDSSWSPAGDYSLDAFARDLRAVARELGGAPSVVG